jgi:hypothetical protein
LKDVEGSLAISVFEGGPGHCLKNVGQEASGLREGSCGDFVGSRRGEMMESERGQRPGGGFTVAWTVARGGDQPSDRGGSSRPIGESRPNSWEKYA